MANQNPSFPDRFELIPLSSEEQSVLSQLLLDARLMQDPSASAMVTKAFKLLCFSYRAGKKISGVSHYHSALQVAQALLTHMKPDAETLAAVLIYDPLDVPKWPLKKIPDEFSSTVAQLVNGMITYRHLYELERIERSEDFADLLNYTADDLRNTHIFLAHRLFILQTIPQIPVQRRVDIGKTAMDTLAPMAAKIQLETVAEELEDLGFKATDPVGYKFIIRKLGEKKAISELFVREFLEPVQTVLEQSGLHYTLRGWPRNVYSWYRDMAKQKKSFESIFGQFKIEIILAEHHTRDDCRRVNSLLKREFTTIYDKFADFITRAGEGGYEALHTAVITESGIEVEIRIRIKKMDE